MTAWTQVKVTEEQLALILAWGVEAYGARNETEALRLILTDYFRRYGKPYPASPTWGGKRAGSGRPRKPRRKRRATAE